MEGCRIGCSCTSDLYNVSFFWWTSQQIGQIFSGHTHYWCGSGHIRCDDIDIANTANVLMQQQCTEAKVKIMDKFVDAVVERTHFISKPSFF